MIESDEVRRESARRMAAKIKDAISAAEQMSSDGRALTGTEVAAVAFATLADSLNEDERRYLAEQALGELVHAKVTALGYDDPIGGAA
jgi:hypothetical protein